MIKIKKFPICRIEAEKINEIDLIMLGEKKLDLNIIGSGKCKIITSTHGQKNKEIELPCSSLILTL